MGSKKKTSAFLMTAIVFLVCRLLRLIIIMEPITGSLAKKLAPPSSWSSQVLRDPDRLSVRPSVRSVGSLVSRAFVCGSADIVIDLDFLVSSNARGFIFVPSRISFGALYFTVGGCVEATRLGR